MGVLSAACFTPRPDQGYSAQSDDFGNLQVLSHLAETCVNPCLPAVVRRALVHMEYLTLERAP